MQFCTSGKTFVRPLGEKIVMLDPSTMAAGKCHAVTRLARQIVIAYVVCRLAGDTTFSLSPSCSHVSSPHGSLVGQRPTWAYGKAVRVQA